MANKCLQRISILWNGYGIFEILFWVIVYMTSFYGMAIYSYYTFQRYNSDPVSMIPNTEYIHWNFSFPGISICLVKGKGSQPLQEAVQKINISYMGPETTLLRNIHNCMFFDPTSHYSTFGKCEEMQSKFGIDYSNIKDQFLPHNCSQFMEHLRYDNKLYNCADIFKLKKLSVGYCFIANNIVDSGFDFENVKLKYSILSKNMRLSVRLKAFRLWNYVLHVHSPNELPYYNTISRDIFSTETVYSYNVDRIMTNSDAAEKTIRQRGCRFVHEWEHAFPSYYSFNTCIAYLKAQLELRECNCTGFSKRDFYSTLFCNSSEIICLVNADIGTKLRHLVKASGKCVPSCIEDVIRYTGQSEMQSETNDSYTDISVELSNFPFAIFQREVTRTKFDAAVSIAGLAGLFFGVSVLNLLEVIYYLLTSK